MNTKLDKKEELICKIIKMPASDIRMVRVFIAGMEAERTSRKCENAEGMNNDVKN